MKNQIQAEINTSRAPSGAQVKTGEAKDEGQQDAGFPTELKESKAFSDLRDAVIEANGLIHLLSRNVAATIESDQESCYVDKPECVSYGVCKMAGSVSTRLDFALFQLTRALVERAENR